MNYFSNARSQKGKLITIPSQKRTVEYVNKVVVEGEKMVPKKLFLQKILFKTVPNCDMNAGW